MKQSKKWLVFATVAFGVLMATLDSSIVNIALPTIRKQLNAGDAVQWIVLSYMLATTSTLLIMGRISDMIGRRTIYISGFLIFTFGSLLCGLAWSIWSLVGFRIVQGLGASMLFSIGPAVISDTFEKHERGKALGLIGTIVAVGSSMGPVVGGLLLGKFGWPSIFLVNIPLGIFAAWRASVVLSKEEKKVHRNFDILGGGLFFISVTLLLCGLYFGPEYGWTKAWVLSFIIIGIALFALFIFWETRAREPMLRLGMFRNKPFSAAISSAGISFVGAGGGLFMLPFFLQNVLHFDPEYAGLIMLAGPVALSVASPLGGYLADKIHSRWIASCGLLIASVGYYMFSYIDASWTWTDIVWKSALLSFGFGLFQSPNNMTALNAASIEERGISSSLLAFMRNLGLVLGIALTAAIWYSIRSHHASVHDLHTLSDEAQISGMRVAYQVISGLVLTGALISFTRPKT